MTATTTKNYELIPFKTSVNRFRIKALRDIPIHGVKKGDWGGVVESENNLSQKEDGWITKDAEVSGHARVLNGYICGISHVLGHTEVRSGYIKDSILTGEGVIGGISGTIMIVNSELENCSFLSTTRIKDSTLENISSSNPVEMEHVDAVCSDKISLWGETNWKRVKCKCEMATFHRESNLSYVELFTPTFTSETAVTIEYAKLRSEELIILSAWKNNLTYTTEIKGASNGLLTCDVEKLNLRESSIYGQVQLSGSLFFIRSIVYGDVQLKGEIVFSDSKILDSVNIQAYDLSLERCQLSDMASIVQETDKSLNLENLSLCFDETYIC